MDAGKKNPAQCFVLPGHFERFGAVRAGSKLAAQIPSELKPYRQRIDGEQRDVDTYTKFLAATFELETPTGKPPSSLHIGVRDHFDWRELDSHNFIVEGDSAGRVKSVRKGWSGDGGEVKPVDCDKLPAGEKTWGNPEYWGSPYNFKK